MAGRKRARHTARKRSRTAAGPRAESLRDVRIRVTTIGDLLLTAADEHPDADALVFPGKRDRVRQACGARHGARARTEGPRRAAARARRAAAPHLPGVRRVLLCDRAVRRRRRADQRAIPRARAGLRDRERRPRHDRHDGTRRRSGRFRRAADRSAAGARRAARPSEPRRSTPRRGSATCCCSAPRSTPRSYPSAGHGSSRSASRSTTCIAAAWAYGFATSV